MSDSYLLAFLFLFFFFLFFFGIRSSYLHVNFNGFAAYLCRGSTCKIIQTTLSVRNPSDSVMEIAINFRLGLIDMDLGACVSRFAPSLSCKR